MKKDAGCLGLRLQFSAEEIVLLLTWLKIELKFNILFFMQYSKFSSFFSSLQN